MNILMVTSLLPYGRANTGGSVVMHGTLMAAAANNRVTLLTFATRRDEDLGVIDELSQAGVDVRPVWLSERAGERTVLGRLRLAATWTLSDNPLRSIAYHSAEMQRLIARLETSLRFDLIHVQDSAMGQYRFTTTPPMLLSELEVRATPFAPPWASGFAGRPLVAAEHRRWMAYQSKVWSRFDCIHVLTREDRDCIARIQPGLLRRTNINPFGVDVPPLLTSDKESPGTLLFIGNFLHPPNVDAAMWLGREIMPAVMQKYPAAVLTIAGPHAPSAVRQLASDAIAVVGELGSLEDQLRNAAVVVAPVRLGGGMRVKVLQAMAHSKPVVTTPLGAAGISVAGHAPLAIAADTESFAAATARLLYDRGERMDLGARARDHVLGHFTWAAHETRLERSYRKLMTGNSARGHVQ